MKQSCIRYLYKFIPLFLLLFFSFPYNSHAQSSCLENMTADADGGACCAVVSFGSKSLVQGVAEEDITLSSGTVTTQTGVAYNPDLEYYYQVDGGKPDYFVKTFDKDGNLLNSQPGNFDYRGLWWNPNDKVLQGNGYNTYGYITDDLDADGYMIGVGSIVPGYNQPYVQSVMDYDYDTDEVIGWYSSTNRISRYDLNGNFLGDYTITGTPSGADFNRFTVGYSGVVGNEIMLYDYVAKKVLFYDKATGAYQTEIPLPGSASSGSYMNSYNVSYANNRIWLYDTGTDLWTSFIITTGEGGGFGSDLTVVQTAGLESGSCFPVGETTNTFTVTDNETGASTTCSFTVTVIDTEIPELSCPQDVFIGCGDSTSPDNTGSPTATTNCSNMSSLIMSYSDSKEYNAGDEIITRTWTVSYESGTVTESCEQVITIEGITDADSQNSWIQTVDIANLYNDSGNDGGFTEFSMNTLLTIGESHTAILTPGLIDPTERAYWRIYIDYNKDGKFHHGSERALQANGIGEIIKTLNVKSSALEGNTKMRITMGTDGYVFPCDAGFTGEVEDYVVEMAVCNPTSFAGTIGYDQAICPSNDDPNFIDDVFGNATQTDDGELFFYEYIWMMNETNCEPTDGTESNGWSIIDGAVSSFYNPGPLSTSTVFVRGTRTYGCQEYVWSNMVEIVYTEDCIPDCSSEGLSTANEYIFRVKFGNVNNISGDDGGYGDYTSMTANVDPGQKVPYQFRPKFYNGSHTVYWRVWADWNQDGHFSNLCELVFEGSSNHTENGNYTVPETAYYGQTKLRVAMKYGSYPESCESFDNGEVEDYSIMVGDDVTAQAEDNDEQNAELSTIQSRSLDSDAFDYSISPNPSTGVIDINLINLAEDNNLNIHDQLGKVVLTKVNIMIDQKLQLNLRDQGLNNGVYFVKLRSGNKFITKKIVLVD